MQVDGIAVGMARKQDGGQVWVVPTRVWAKGSHGSKAMSVTDRTGKWLQSWRRCGEGRRRLRTWLKCHGYGLGSPCGEDNEP